MADFVSLVLSFPSIVEGVVKTCRSVQEYRHLQHNHMEAIKRASFGSRKLAYYVSFIDVDTAKSGIAADDSQQQYLLEEAVLHAYNAMLTTARVVEDWTIRLQITTHSNSRIFMARMAQNIAERLMLKYKLEPLSRFRRSKVGKLTSEIAYLAMGCRQINDSMDVLEKWTGDVGDILLSFQTLKNVRDPISHTSITSMKECLDDVLFVASCRRRLEENLPAHRIDASEIDTYVDLDPARPTGFYMIEKGRYMGCVINRRDVNHLYRKESLVQKAVTETEYIARLFAEEKSGTAIIQTFAGSAMLSCCGWAKVSAEFYSNEHDLVLRPPSGMRQPRTLRMLLLEGEPRHSLDDRLRFAIQLSTSVLIVHSLGIVHKDIRPDSVLVFEPLMGDEGDLFPMKLGTPYLANFDRARPDSADTTITPFKYSHYMRVAYTHPVHTTTTEHIRYHMRDDVYSLGVVLIEVALWKSLFSWKERRECYDADFSWFDFSIDKYKRMFLEMGQPEYRNRGWLMRWDLIRLAEKEIPPVMGSKFKDVVVSCLMFGEKSKPTFNESVMKITDTEYENKNESVAFVQDVLSRLRSLNFS
ncbi:hypothetical protein ACEPAG_3782 [Sanghuangporus baumii]